MTSMFITYIQEISFKLHIFTTTITYIMWILYYALCTLIPNNNIALLVFTYPISLLPVKADIQEDFYDPYFPFY